MADVVYRFRAVGADSVAKAYETIGRARKAQVATEREANTYARQATRSSGDAAKAQQRQADAAAKAAIRAEVRKNQELARERKKGENEAVRDSAREFRRLMQERSKARVAESRDREASLQADKRHRARSEAEALADARRESRKLFQTRRQQERELIRSQARARGQSVIGRGGVIDSGIERLTSNVGTYLALGSGAVIAGGVALAGGAARDAMSLDETSRKIAIQGRQAGGQFVDPKELSREFLNTAVATPGQKASDIAEAISMYVGKTGDLGTARKMSGTFATVASASGTQVQDIAVMASQIAEKFGIKTEAGMKDAMASIYFQGKSGAFELKDAANQYTEMTAAGARFGLNNGVEGIKTLGGLTQIAIGGTGNPAEASTAVQSMFTQLGASADLVKRTTGADVYTDKTQTKGREITTVLKDVIAGAKGNIPTLQKIFDIRGMKAVSGLITAFNDAQNAAGKNATEAERTAAGMAAMDDVLKKAIGAGTSFSEVQQDAAFQQQSASAKMTNAWQMMIDQVGGPVADQLVKLVETLSTSEGGIVALGTAADLCAQALVNIVDFAKTIPGIGKLFEPGAKTPEQRQADVAAADAEIQKIVDAGGTVPAELMAKRAAAGAAVSSTKVLSPEEYSKAMDNAKDPGAPKLGVGGGPGLMNTLFGPIADTIGVASDVIRGEPLSGKSRMSSKQEEVYNAQVQAEAAAGITTASKINDMLNALAKALGAGSGISVTGQGNLLGG